MTAAKRRTSSRFRLIPLALFTATLAATADDEDYLRHASFEMAGHEHVLLRWPERKMPLRVYLTVPPEGLFPDPRVMHDAVRRGILDWSDVAEPGIPRFVFVDAIGDADIPIVWAEEPAGDWYIARCAYLIRPVRRHFDVDHIMVTGRWADRIADPNDVYRMVLHEVGHALGIGGHSPKAGDIMFASIKGGAQGLSERDRNTLKALYARPIGARISGARGAHAR